MAEELEEVIRFFSDLPGLGKKSAVRIAFHLLRQEEREIKNFIHAIHHLKENVEFCSICGALKSKAEDCSFCNSQKRDKETICVVEQPSDVMAIENTGEYYGLYHVLMGVLSPIDGFGPDDIRLQELLARVDENTKEIIVATNPSIEGNATANYISSLLVEHPHVKITRIASGLALGSQLEYADSRVLSQSLRGRVILE